MTEKKPAGKPGQALITIGLVALALGAVVLVMNLTSTQVNYVPGLGNVETKGTPSAGSIILLIVGVLLAGVGFARRMLSAVERR